MSHKSPIVISGCPRSGTTALLRLLNASGIVVTNEWSLLSEPSIPYDRRDFLLEKFDVINFGPYSDWHSSGTGLKMKFQEEWLELEYSKLIHLCLGNNEFWGDKWTYETNFIRVLENFPLAKLIYIFRDPRDVVVSMLNASFFDTLEKCFSVWEQSVLAYLEFSKKYPVCLVYQNELASNASTVCEKLTQFLNLKVSYYDCFQYDGESQPQFIGRNKSHEGFYNKYNNSHIPQKIIDLANQFGCDI